MREKASSRTDEEKKRASHFEGTLLNLTNSSGGGGRGNKSPGRAEGDKRSGGGLGFKWAGRWNLLCGSRDERKDVGVT